MIRILTRCESFLKRNRLALATQKCLICLNMGSHTGSVYPMSCIKPRQSRACDEAELNVMRLTERSLHVIGRTSRGMPDQLCFRSSSVTAECGVNTFKHTAGCISQCSVKPMITYALPRSVLGLASSCLNLSSRLFSRTVMGGAPDAFWSDMRATSGMMGRTGRDCCFCRLERTAGGHATILRILCI